MNILPSISKKNGTIVAICILSLLVFIKYSNVFQNRMEGKDSQVQAVNSTTKSIDKSPSNISSLDIQLKNFSDLPDYVKHTIVFLKQNNFSKVEVGYVGGRYFTNYEKSLPWISGTYYKEWDVHSKIKGVNRGTERLVTGDKGEIYFTNTHYGSAGSPAFYLIQF